MLFGSYLKQGLAFEDGSRWHSDQVSCCRPIRLGCCQSDVRCLSDRYLHERIGECMVCCAFLQMLWHTSVQRYEDGLIPGCFGQDHVCSISRWLKLFRASRTREPIRTSASDVATCADFSFNMFDASAAIQASTPV